MLTANSYKESDNAGMSLHASQYIKKKDPTTKIFSQASSIITSVVSLLRGVFPEKEPTPFTASLLPPLYVHSQAKAEPR